MKKYLAHIDVRTVRIALITFTILATLVTTMLSVHVAFGTVCDNPQNPCGLTSADNPKGCVGTNNQNGGFSCGSGSGNNSTEGDPCESAANACGAVTTGGIIKNGVCSVAVQTGTDGKGNPTYSYPAITAPALPAGYGATCQSAANSCGRQNTGTINCSGTCSAVKPLNPRNLGVTCSATSACGTNTGTYICSNSVVSGVSCSVSAPTVPAGYGTSCQSAANACGATGSGTIQCSGSCSAAVPALPAGYGVSCQSAANICGMRNTGVINCSAVCSASKPSDNLCAPDVSITIKATPGLVQNGSTSTIIWSSTDATSCTVAGTNGDAWTGTSGSRSTRAISGRVTYTINCTGINTHTATKSIIVDLVPVYQEQ